MALTIRPRIVLPFVASLLVGFAISETASAQDRGAFPLDKPASRRSGLVVGLSLGTSVTAGSGYPNSATRMQDPRYYAASGVVVGTSSTLMIMGALTDYLNFGFWGGGGGGENDDWKLTSAGGGVRVEGFPLFYLVPKLRDLGFSGQFGVGSAKMEAKHGASEGGEGVQSFVGGGVFYEFRLFNPFGTHFTLAPSVEYQAVFSDPFESHGVVAGVRLALYGGP
ncbi:hypothetical protein LZC95_08725 [Pendulispora brunnea]|uniref:Outer membrane protein beta-barrel domain-containing protein n=1 Tax=Pendulispora brunnea TaxID=2905690 RepID=A0ABZ2KIN0_9BACT